MNLWRVLITFWSSYINISGGGVSVNTEASKAFCWPRIMYYFFYSICATEQNHTIQMINTLFLMTY